MKNSRKIVLGGLGILGLAIAYKCVKRFYQKEGAKIDKENADRRAGLASIGVDEDELENDLIPLDDIGNLPKAMFIGAQKSPEFVISEVSPEDVISEDGYMEIEHVLHVMQTPAFGRNGKETLDFVFEIPNTVFDVNPRRRGNIPGIGEYIRGIKDLGTELWSDVVRFSEKPFIRLEGFLVIDYTKPDDPHTYQRFLEIPKEYYEKYSDAETKRDGLTDFLKALRLGESNITDLPTTPILNSMKRAGITEVWETVSLREMRLTMRISFPIADRRSGSENIFGITLETGLKCLKHILESFSLKRGNTELVNYRGVVFNAPEASTDGKWNHLMYYDYDESANVVVKSYIDTEVDNDCD